MSDFSIIGCHANRASEASVTLRHMATGALVSVHHVPFQHDYGETSAAECDRIQLRAAQIAREAADFLAREADGAPVMNDDRPSAPTGHAPRPLHPIR